MTTVREWMDLLKDKKEHYEISEEFRLYNKCWGGHQKRWHPDIFLIKKRKGKEKKTAL